MMTSTRFSLILLAALSFLTIFSCGDKCEELREFVKYEPVYVTQEEYSRPVTYEAAREVDEAGVIASYGQYLFVNELNEGIHLINNSDPANPVNEGFIVINNNKHFAIKNGILLANRYHDLVSVDIRNIDNVHEIQRTTNVFIDESLVTEEGIIAHYEKTTEIETRDCENPFFGSWWMEDDFIMMESMTFDAPIMSSTDARAFQANGTSVSSSTARFTISNDALFVLNSFTLEIFDLSNPSSPERINTVNVNNQSETLFPLNQYLFIGAMNGMSIYDISTPSSPQYVSEFSHAMACDPVVANERNAYVTLRSGNQCAGFRNQLDVVNIENINFPNLVSSHNLSNPRGLAVVGDHLFVCDGAQGIVVYNTRDENNVHQVGNYRSKQANDVLPISESIVVVSGDDGIFELDITDPTNPSLLSIVTTK